MTKNIATESGWTNWRNIFSSKHQLFALILLTIGLNINTIFNDYALDDIVVLTENRFVAKGLKGIPEILSTEYTAGYTTKENLLTGSRYRPVSLILFAIEYQLFGVNPFVSHLLNVLCFVLVVILVYKLLRDYLFRDQDTLIPFFACLLFAAHPVHTEVIANVKGRDEILTFLFLLLSLTCILKYIERKALVPLVMSLVFFSLALLTKETAVTFLAIVPLILYFFFNKSIGESIRQIIPLGIVFTGYMLVRYYVVGFTGHPVNDVTNTPFLYASASESFATKIFILVKYLGLLFYPSPLSSDYGYNQIPYIGISSLRFILSFVLLAGLICFAFYVARDRSITAFCIFYFFVTISVASNFIIDLGTTFAERMLFLPSLAFCIFAAHMILKMQNRSFVIPGVLLILILSFYSLKTIARNREWQNNETLFLADVKTSPDCSRLNLFVSERYIMKANKENDFELKKQYLDTAIQYGQRSLKIHAKFAYTYLRLGLAYYLQLNYFKAAEYWLQAYQLEPMNPETKKWTTFLSGKLQKQGNDFSAAGNFEEAIRYLGKSVELDPGNKEAWKSLGWNYAMKNDSLNAIE